MCRILYMCIDTSNSVSCVEKSEETHVLFLAQNEARVAQEKYMGKFLFS